MSASFKCCLINVTIKAERGCLEKVCLDCVDFNTLWLANVLALETEAFFSNYYGNVFIAFYIFELCL